jgi:hypothetical protein
MDVTHVPSFGGQCYVHMSLDTYSGYIYASAHTGEATKHVIAYCLVAFSAMGKPQQLSTDNGPTFNCFLAFLRGLSDTPHHRYAL